MQTPSAGNQQPWEFYVVEDESIIQQLATISPYAGCVVHAKTVIVSVYRKEIKFPAFAQIDLSIAQENMWLETDALGLGGVWLGVAPIQERMDAVKNILKLPEEVEAFLVFPVGYPAAFHRQQDRIDLERIHWVDAK